MKSPTDLYPSTSSYYPFGMQMPGRLWNGGGYRFGYDAQEKDDEVAGTGNINTAAFWEYDTRLGRRWNVDPKYKSYISNYSAFGLNPILNIDPKGDDFYKNKATGNIEEHPTAWFDKLSRADQAKWSYQGKYSYKNWEGHRSFTNWWLIAIGNKIDRALEGHNDPANLGATEQETREAKDGLLIVGGVVTVVASWGLATPWVAAFGVTSGLMSTAGGTTKLVLDIKKDYNLSDKVPTGILNATVGATAEYIIGDPKDKRVIYVKGALTIAEGVITFSPYKLPTSLTDLSGKAVTIGTIVIDDDASKALKQLKK